ncbi:MAG TPA: hypothetical protein VFX50_09340, partial [Gemmatimonadales bacterium]|nr:hypothetical protein [Gemmatimonadales bacterium]
MRSLHAVAVLLAVTPTLQAQAQAVPQYTIEQFMKTVSVRGASFAPDEKTILYASNQDGVFNLYEIPVTGGAATQRTTWTENGYLGAATFFPKDKRILYFRDIGGNENTHAFVLSPDGSVKDLTPGDKVRAQFGGWATDDKSFFVSTNARDPKFFDLYEVPVATLEPTLLYQNTDGYFIGPVSPDRRYVALVKPYTTQNNDLFLYDRTTKQATLISKHEGDATYSTSGFSPDG